MFGAKLPYDLPWICGLLRYTRLPSVHLEAVGRFLWRIRAPLGVFPQCPGVRFRTGQRVVFRGAGAEVRSGKGAG